jgi:hypothetical protein
MPRVVKSEIEWEMIQYTREVQTYRAKIYSGWLVKVSEVNGEFGNTCGLAFVPDKQHVWTL